MRSKVGGPVLRSQHVIPFLFLLLILHKFLLTGHSDPVCTTSAFQAPWTFTVGPQLSL